MYLMTKVQILKFQTFKVRTPMKFKTYNSNETFSFGSRFSGQTTKTTQEKEVIKTQVNTKMPKTLLIGLHEKNFYPILEIRKFLAFVEKPYRQT